MDHLQRELAEGVRRYDAWGWARPGVALVSGSGLAVDLDLPSRGRRPLQDLLPWPSRGIAGHPMEVELLQPDGAPPILYYRGRLHAYQGYTAAQAVYTVRLAALLGAEALLLTNAAGAIDSELPPGRLVLISDHLNLSGLNPLVGEPPIEWGPRFPDMSAAYDPQLRRHLRRTADELGIALAEGVYAGMPGPSYETPAEVRMLRQLGASVVGMSTVLEVIAARHLGMRCAAISLASNPAAGISDQPLDHQEVLDLGRQAASSLQRLFGAVLAGPLPARDGARGRPASQPAT